MRVSYQSDGSSIGTDNCLSGANCGTDLCRNHGATAIRFSSARSNSSKWALSAQEQEAAKNRRFGTVWLPAARQSASRSTRRGCFVLVGSARTSVADARLCYFGPWPLIE